MAIMLKWNKKGGAKVYKEFFGERLKLARNEAGYSQMQVKERTGINQTALSRYENGEREPDIETIGILANFYEVSIDWLFGNVKKK